MTTDQPLEQDPSVITINPNPDCPFNPHRQPCTDRGHEATTLVIRQVQNYETFMGLRQRARRSTDQATFEQTVTAIVSDLIYQHCLNPEVKVYISLSKQKIGRKSRYTPQVLGKTLPTTLKHLSAPEMAFVELEKGHRLLNRQTTIRAGRRLATLISELGLSFRDFDENGSPEVIWLRESHPPDEKHWRKGKFLEYSDTPDTTKFRLEMERINAYLAAAQDITFDTSAAGLPSKGPVNLRDRSLRRIFNNGSFTQGGRLYGGFWQEGLKKEERKGIRIGGELTVCLDYSQVCPRILYGMAGAEPRLADLYTVPGLDRYREGVKKVLVSLLFSSNGALSQVPHGSRPLLPKKMKVAEIVRLIEKAHPALASYFGKGIGMELMFKESQILVEVLLTLADQGVVALPIHDAVVVKAADEATTRKLMEEVFKKHTGLDIEVKAE
jgi:hypothetical protein